MLMGAIMLIQPVMNWSAKLLVLRPVYLHYLFIGWVTQIIMGVGYWMFPKFSKENPRGNERLGWFVLCSLNLGLILRGVGEPLITLYPETGFKWILPLAALFLLLACWGFILNTWGRIKER